MKLSKNSVLAAVLCVICVGVVAVCLYPGRTERSDFTPDTPENNTPLIWEDKLGFGESNSAPTNHSGVSTAAPNEYPKQSVDSEGNVSVEFTPDAEDLMPDEPEAPISEDDYTNQEAPPSYKPEQVNPSPKPTKPSASNEPTHGSSNKNGAVYDPVFGWIVPGEFVSTPVDSEGDPNKMVGDMGP